MTIFLIHSKQLHFKKKKIYLSCAIWCQVFIFLLAFLLAGFFLALFSFLADFTLFTLVSFYCLQILDISELNIFLASFHAHFHWPCILLLLTIFNRSNSSRISTSTCRLISSSTSLLLASLIISSSYAWALLSCSARFFQVS